MKMKMNFSSIAKALCVAAIGLGVSSLTSYAHSAEANKKQVKTIQVKPKQAKPKQVKTIQAKQVKKIQAKQVLNKKSKQPTFNQDHKRRLAVAKSFTQPSNIKYTVFNYATGQILEDNSPNVVWPIASLTKLMTAYVFVSNTTNLKNCTTSITEEDTDLIKRTRTRLSPYKPYSCENLLEIMLIASDNYAASALARSVPGWSKSDFIKKMNSQAKEWGLSNTTFVDSSGLSPENRSSVEDYRKLTMNVVKNQNISKISALHSITAENKWNKNIIYKNSNKLVREFGFDVNLSKTGYIRESGYNLVHLANCPNNIGVIEFGARSSEQRASFVKQKLSKYGCA